MFTPDHLFYSGGPPKIFVYKQYDKNNRYTITKDSQRDHYYVLMTLDYNTVLRSC